MHVSNEHIKSTTICCTMKIFGQVSVAWVESTTQLSSPCLNFSQVLFS